MFVNQYSYVLVAIALLIGSILWANAGAWQLWRVGVLLVVVIGLGVLAFASQRTATTESMHVAFQDHKIVLVEYYSDY